MDPTRGTAARCVVAGTLARLRLVGLDTSLFIYAWEYNPRFGDGAQSIVEAVEAGSPRAVVSTLLLTERLVGPLRAGRLEMASRHRDRLSRFPNLTMVAPSEAICWRAAQLRADVPRLRLVDAVHIATAIESGATAFVTNDFDVHADLGIEIVQLSDLV